MILHALEDDQPITRRLDAIVIDPKRCADFEVDDLVSIRRLADSLSVFCVSRMQTASVPGSTMHSSTMSSAKKCDLPIRDRRSTLVSRRLEERTENCRCRDLERGRALCRLEGGAVRATRAIRSILGLLPDR